MSHKVTQVLVAGAGPTGLTAACELARRGVRVRVVEARRAPATAPRAVLLWPPALRALDGLGLGGRVREAAAELPRAIFHSGGRPVAPLDLERHGAPLILPQERTERLLTGLLGELGVEVERGVRLTGVRQGTGGVTATLESGGGAGGRAYAEADWLVGADGMHSTVRAAVGIRFPLVTFGTRYLLGEGRLEGPGADPSAAHYYTGPDGIVGVIPLTGGRYRVSGGLPPGEARPSPQLVQRLLDERGPGGLAFRDASWVGEFDVHRALAARLRAGRVFLAGEAAHVGPPLGAQGLTLGVQDAQNLAWKLAEVIAGRAHEALLDTYETERRAAGRRSVRDVRAALRMWTLTDSRARALRDSALDLLRLAGLLGSVYGPLYTSHRQRYRPGVAVAMPAAGPCAARARFLSRDGEGMPLSASLHQLLRLNTASRHRPLGPFDPLDTRLVLLTVHADRAPGLLAAATRFAARRPAIIVHCDVPALRLSPTAAAGSHAPQPATPCHRPGYYLIRPDGIVAVHRHGADLSAAVALLRSLARE